MSKASEKKADEAAAAAEEGAKEEAVAVNKSWVRREISLAAAGLTEDERAEKNP